MTEVLSSLPGVTDNALVRQQERWGAPWPVEAWLSVVTQILDRTALLVGVNPSTRKTPRMSEIWLVETPSGPVRVVWVPAGGCIVTVMGPGRMHSTATYGKHKLGISRPAAHHAADNTNRPHRKREKAEWMRAAREDES